MVRTRLGKEVLLDEREARSATDKKNNNPRSLNNHMLQRSFRNEIFQEITTAPRGNKTSDATPMNAPCIMIICTLESEWHWPYLFASSKKRR